MENRIFEQMCEVENQHWWFVARRTIIAAVIKKIANNKTLNIFDIGCGNGDNLAMLASYGNLISMEKDGNALANALKREVCPVYQGELPDNIPPAIATNNDLIVMLDVLEHIEDDERALLAIKGFLKKAGALLMTVPAYQFLWTYHDDIHHHKRRYTVYELKNKLEKCGWEVEHIAFFNTFLFPLAVIDRMIGKLFPSKKNDSLTMPPPLINSLLKQTFLLEKWFINHVSFPFGLSIIVRASKKVEL